MSSGNGMAEALVEADQRRYEYMKNTDPRLYYQLGTLVYELQKLRKDMADGKIPDKNQAIKRYLEIIEEYGPRE